MSASLQEQFAPEPVPEWLLAFDADPVAAVDGLLTRRFFLGRLNAAEPDELLVDWALLLGDEEGFVCRLDAALAAWVETTWGAFPAGLSAARLADAWSRLANVVAFIEDLTQTARALRERFDDRDDYLRPMSEGRSRDPVGRYLAAIAEHQDDSSLAPFWWQLCALPEGVPFYHGRYAIAGLLGLSPFDPKQAGGFREHVVHGVLRLAEALQSRIDLQEVPRSRAREEWLWIGRLALARLPFPARWREILVEATATGLSESCMDWLEALTPGFARDREGRGRDTSRRSKGSEAQPTFDIYSWRTRAESIAAALRENRPDALDRAEALLAEEERYALVHGESSYLVRSLTNFAKSLWKREPLKAARWAERARAWERSNPFTWTTLVKARLFVETPDAVLPMAWEAVERFPEDVAVRNSMADILLKSGRREEAEVVCRQSIRDFPANGYGRSILAEILKEAGRLREAEVVYRQAMAMPEFRENFVLPVGLAAVLRLLDSTYWQEALALVEGVLEQEDNRAAALAEKGRLLKALGRSSEAEEAFAASQSRVGDQAPPGHDLDHRAATEVERPHHRHPVFKADEQAALLGEARLLRRWAREGEDLLRGRSAAELRQKAEALLDEATERGRDNPRIQAERGLLWLAEGRLDAARDLLCTARSRLPNAPALLASIARVEREQARTLAISMNEETLAQVNDAPGRLLRLSRGFEPLSRLQRSQAVLALRDGQIRRDRAADELNRLHSWMRPHLASPDDSFASWWSRRLNEKVFAPIAAEADIGASDVDGVSERMENHGPEIETLEEDFWLRAAHGL